MDRRKNSRARRILGALFIVLGLYLVLLPAKMSLEGHLSQRELKRDWESMAFDYEMERIEGPPVPARGTAVVSASEIRAVPPMRLKIPRIGLDAVVVEGVTESALRRGPGRFPSTAGPGEFGNCCIAAHLNAYGAWFRRLNTLSPGDKVVLLTPDSEFVYEVSDKFEVLQTNTSVLRQTVEPSLTLITCSPGPRNTYRLVVVADLMYTHK